MFKIATFNVNSVNARMPILGLWLEKEKIDVVALQEIKCPDEKFPLEAFEDMGYHAAVRGQRSYNGVAILS
jgi:exodeoxyribonuclease-3